MARHTLTTYDEEGNEIQVPARYEVCHSCEGEGTTSAHLGTFFPGDPWLEDRDFMEDYAAGRFDQPCPTCSGRTTVLVLDRVEATAHERYLFDRMEREIAEMHAEQAAEQRAGC